MRLSCLLANDDSWVHSRRPLKCCVVEGHTDVLDRPKFQTADCYSVIREDRSEYDLPQAILCRLILTTRRSLEFEEVRPAF